jgi:hypothetical protein
VARAMFWLYETIERHEHWNSQRGRALILQPTQRSIETRIRPVFLFNYMMQLVAKAMTQDVQSMIDGLAALTSISEKVEDEI